MADIERETGTETETPGQTAGQPGETQALARPGRRFDPLTLVVGLVSLAVATMALTGWTPDLRWLDLRWVLAAAAVGLGAFLLVGSLRRDPVGPDQVRAESAE